MDNLLADPTIAYGKAVNGARGVATDNDADDGGVVDDIKSDDARKLDFTVMKTKLNQAVDNWSHEVTRTEQRQKNRRNELDVDGMRKNGQLMADETFIPCRIINSNIEREQPPYISFLKNERRVAIFQDVKDNTRDTQEIETQFTHGMTYCGWELPFFKVLDGGQLHGWDAIETVFDETKPLHISHEQIGHDNLVFPSDAIDIQYCEHPQRRYKLTLTQLEKFVKEHGFDKDQVAKIRDKYKDQSTHEKTIIVYKSWFRVDGIVHVSWWSKECDDWLKKPLPAYVGIRHQETINVPNVVPAQITTDPVSGQQMVIPEHVEQIPTQQWVDTPLQNYPIFLFLYKEQEAAEIFHHAGRGDTDLFKQEIVSALTSALANQANRAAKLFGSPETNNGVTTSPKIVEGISFKNGTFFDAPIKFFTTPNPDPQLLNIVQYFDVQNAQENGQMSFAVNNRVDSRKTAAEINSAQAQNSQLSSVQVTMWSIFLRQVFSFDWLIVQSQALQNKITFMATEDQEGNMVNDIATIGRQYDLKAAGDVDVVMRAEKLARMQQFFSAVSNFQAIMQNPLARIFLMDMLTLAFPDDAKKYQKAIGELNEIMVLKNGIMDGMQAIAQLVTPIAKDIPPQIMSQLQQIGTNLMGLVNQGAVPPTQGQGAPQQSQPNA